MRIRSLLAALAAMAALGAGAPQSAQAGWDREDRPAGWGQERSVRHWVYYPRYNHVYLRAASTDPYAYRYEPRGYYPYYNSGYWVPACQYCRPRTNFKLPKYYKAWGAKKRNYDHIEWHGRHHGGHRHHHW